MASKAWLVFFFVANIVLLYYYFHTMQSALSDEPTCKRPAGRNAFPGDWSRTNRSYNQLKLNLDWERIPRKSSPPPEELHDKWIVLTTVSLPTEDVKKLAKIDGWKVVVVGDTKTPAGWSHPNCVFLSVEKQKTLGYRIHDLIPYKSYARKNIGYLYAIQHGAKVIYETDDDNCPTSGKITFHLENTGEFYVYKTDSSVVNPYEHFGQSSIWPRGYPLDRIADPPSHTFIKCAEVETPVQQGIVNGDPDVDAIFRLTRKDKDVPLNVEFDADADPVVLPPKTLAPFNSQNTLFLYKGLWAMLLPTSVAFRVTDIWRGYWAQRLLWDIGSHLSFFPPNAVQVRNAHDYLADFTDEQQMNLHSSRFVKFLINWRSDKPAFFGRALDLGVEMYKNDLWEWHDVILTEAWLEDLVSIGYEMPLVQPISKPCKKFVGEETVLQPKEKPSSFLRAGKELQTIKFTGS